MKFTLGKSAHRWTLQTQHIGLSHSSSSIRRCRLERKEGSEQKWAWVRETWGKTRNYMQCRAKKRRQAALFTEWATALLEDAAEMSASMVDRELDGGVTDCYKRKKEIPGRNLFSDTWRWLWQLQSCTISYKPRAVTILTPVEFTQTARVAEGADRPGLPAAPALHPTLCRPDPTPRSLRCDAALVPLRNHSEGRAEALTFLSPALQHAHK